MKNIADNVVIQIEVTNACHLSCANCSRFVGHHKNPYYMSLDEVEKAIKSLDGFGGRIGLMGGEPSLHPNFVEICNLFIDLIPDKRRREFWTAGYKWDEFKEIREKTFDSDLVHYNDHSKPEEGWHQPLLVSIDEVVEDKEKMWKLINNCWVQRRWSASITPKGAFFCEVAAALHHAMSGPDGWPIEKDWWKKTTEDYEKQKHFACLKCSAALPMAEIPNNHVPQDLVSSGNLEILEREQSPKAKYKRIKIVSATDAVSYLNSQPEVVLGERGYLSSHPDWRPSEFRTKVWHSPGEGGLSAGEVRAMQKKGVGVDQAAQSKGVNNFVVSKTHSGSLKLTDKIIQSIKKDIGEKAESLDPLVGFEFNSASELFRSIDDWTEGEFETREKDVVLKHIAEFKN